MKLSLRVIFLAPLDSPRLGKATVLQVICPRCLFARLLCVHFYATNICTGMGHPFLIPMSSIYPCINQVPLWYNCCHQIPVWCKGDIKLSTAHSETCLLWRFGPKWTPWCLILKINYTSSHIYIIEWTLEKINRANISIWGQGETASSTVPEHLVNSNVLKIYLILFSKRIYQIYIKYTKDF